MVAEQKLTVVVVDDISNRLVQHGKQRTQSAAFAFEEYMEVKERKILFCTSFEDHRREGMKHFQPVSDVGIRSALNHCVKRRIHSIP